jgi:DDE domain
MVGLQGMPVIIFLKGGNVESTVDFQIRREVISQQTPKIGSRSVCSTSCRAIADPHDVDKQGSRGTSMKPPSGSRGNGALCIALLMLMATWLIRVLREKRDMEAAQQFFKQVLAVVGHAPERVTTDGHTSYPRAVREILGDSVQHRTSKYLNNRLEQDHRGIKQR